MDRRSKLILVTGGTVATVAAVWYIFKRRRRANWVEPASDAKKTYEMEGKKGEGKERARLENDELESVLRFLCGVSVMRHIPADQYPFIALASEILNYETGETIAKRSDAGGRLYLIKSGRVVASLEDEPQELH